MSPKEVLLPKLFTVLKEKYSAHDFFRDCLAGIIVGIVALPLSIAFAIASGVKPEQGLYTAIIGGFIISLLSGSRVQIGGPTGAFIVIVFHIVQTHGYEGLAVATLMAGAILIFMGIARFGRMIEFIPYPITVGFTSGIAVIIFTSQLRDFFGLKIDDMPAEFLEKIPVLFSHIAMFNSWAVFISVLTIIIITQSSKFIKRIPGSMIAIIVTTAFVYYFHIPVETIHARYGDIPNTLPMPRIPDIEWGMIRDLIMPATTIALLAGLESLLSAVVADGMTGFRHRPNMELVAQGVANIGSVLFGGIPATGAIARTATNIKNGGRSPIAGVVHAITLLLILLIFGKLAGLIPIPTLAAILVVVAYNMSEWRMFVKLFRSPRSDIVVLVTTFLLTVLVDLTIAIEVGVVLAAFLFMNRMADIAQVESVTGSFENDEENENTGKSWPVIPSGIEVFEVNGPFFFGAADKFKTVLNEAQKNTKILILRMRHVPVMDATGLRALEDIFDKSRRNGMVVIISEMQHQPISIFRKSGFDKKVGEENLCKDIDAALERARGLLGKN